MGLYKVFSCKKNVLKLLFLFSILPLLYLWENYRAINWRDFGAVILIILVCINITCNNYKLLITQEEIILERLVGKMLRIKVLDIYQIEMKKAEKDTQLLLYTGQKIYRFSIRCLEEDKVHEELMQRSTAWGIQYKRIEDFSHTECWEEPKKMF